MGFLLRLMTIFAICTALCIALGFLSRLMAVLATCAALAASTMLNWRSIWHRLTSKIPVEPDQVVQLNNSVYELDRPKGTPNMEILFFHGFQRGDYKDAHISTWKTGDGSCVWPQVWLAEKFPEARILCVAYNASELKKSNKAFDMYVICENLTSDLLDENTGQEPCCPVILVGHSFGGLVIEQLCVYASSQRGIWDKRVERSSKVNLFLENVKGMFVYSTPHRGISDGIAELFLEKGPLLEYIKTLNTDAARVHSDFDKLVGQLGPYVKWQIAGLGETCQTNWGGFHDVLVVNEASSRYGPSYNIVEGADHISICRPMKKVSRSFHVLKTFITSLSQARVGELPDHSTALKRRAYEVQVELRNTPALGIVGMGGIGKTTIAHEVFDEVCGQFEYTCFVDNVKDIKAHKLKDRLLNHVLQSGVKADGNSLQWAHLQGKKTLIVMDDVDSKSQFKALPKLDDLGTGSKLIVTSCYHNILKVFTNSVIYEVQLLNFDESKKLFCQHAFNKEEGIPDKLLKMNSHLEENVKKVVQKCDGLPLTLEVMGCYLKGQDTDALIYYVRKLSSSNG